MTTNERQYLSIKADLLKFVFFFSLQISFSSIGAVVFCFDRISFKEVHDLKYLLYSLKFFHG